MLSDECPECMKEYELEGLTGRKVAIDASMAMYQFLIAVRSGGDGNAAASMLTNEAGEVTSHIQGMFNRTIRLLVAGVKPAYVFDGKPPQLKGGELAKRAAKRAKAEVDMKDAEMNGSMEDVDKFSKRLVRVTSQHNEECKKLLRLMGVPVVDASCEAEAQCAALAKAGVVFGTGTEDMDALTFGSPKLLRRMTFSAAKKEPILEVDYTKLLAGLKLTRAEFVDLCILCGCDYTESIRGIGAKTALKLIREHHTIEEILKHIDRSRYGIPLDWLPPDEAAKAAVAAAAKKAKAAAKAAEKAKQKKLVKKVEEVEEVQDSENEGNESHEDDEEPAEKMQEVQDDEEEEPIKSDDAAEAEGEAGSEKEDAVEEEGAEDDKMETDVKADVAPVVEAAKSEEPKEFIPMYQEARRLFEEADVFPASTIQLKWTDPDEKGLTEFLVEKCGFNPDRVSGAIKKLKDARKKGGQQRMDNFFQVTAPPEGSVPAKRKAPEPAKGKGGKGGKGGPPAKKGKTAPAKGGGKAKAGGGKPRK